MTLAGYASARMENSSINCQNNRIRAQPQQLFPSIFLKHTALPQCKPRDEYHAQIRVPMPKLQNSACAKAKLEKSSTG
jgi:hypothetical protein